MSYIFNLFCDASIDLPTSMACAGCIITMQDRDTGKVLWTEPIIKCSIQRNATNNSAEILAIFLGISEAVEIARFNQDPIFRVFSDSKISLYGLRDWMKNWIVNSSEDGTLRSTSGNPVANQQTFVQIYNLIIENNLKVEFYHQRGHVTENGRLGSKESRAYFIKTNKVAPEALGQIDIDYLNIYNNQVDNITRDVLYDFIKTGGTNREVRLEMYKESPIKYFANKDLLPRYISLINKTSVKSHHNFNGGYTQ